MQYALANANPVTADEIWVTKSNSTNPADPPVPYKPSVIYPDGTDARRKTFYVPLGIKVYGGFLGTEGSRDQRNPEANETILDGDIDTSGGNDCYHVVYIDDADYTTTKLSGFTIRNGRADHASDADDKYGGGVFMKRRFTTSTGPSLERLVIRDNVARAGGGGLYTRDLGHGYAANCRFEYNSVTQATTGLGGAALMIGGGKLNFANCTFFNNNCGGTGGALASSAYIWTYHCTFYGNKAVGSAGSRTGGAIYSVPDDTVQIVTVFNCIAWGNDAPQFDSPADPVSAYLHVEYSDVQDGNWPGYNATNNDQDPRFTDADNGVVSLLPCSPCIDDGHEYDGYSAFDATDIDEDANENEPIPWDIQKFRRVSDFKPDTAHELDMGAYEECPGDIDSNGTVDISDLALILSFFGTADCRTVSALCCRANFHSDDCATDHDIDISDLSEFLSHFGQSCYPESEAPAPLTEGSVTISIDGLNTGGYVGGGFYGESQHFVFDALCTIAESADDWVGSGVTVTAANGATFRLVPNAGNTPTPGATIPEKYATLFSQPYAVNASGRFTAPLSDGGIAGKYTGAGAYTYTSTALNATWYDTNAASNDGPAAVFRLVIDVKTVTGADTSGGFGSVYFVATGGSPGAGDIKVADMTFDVEHKYADSGSTVTTGSFYVTN